MLITRTSKLSGETRTREITVTPEQLADFHRGVLIQQAMPYVSSSDREFILTGTTEEEWNEAFPEEEG